MRSRAISTWLNDIGAPPLLEGWTNTGSQSLSASPGTTLRRGASGLAAAENPRAEAPTSGAKGSRALELECERRCLLGDLWWLLPTAGNQGITGIRR